MAVLQIFAEKFAQLFIERRVYREIFVVVLKLEMKEYMKVRANQFMMAKSNLRIQVI